MTMMISFESGTNKFHSRAAGIIVHDNRVLVQKIVNDTLWFIPGGRIEFNESAEETIEREMQEEFSISILSKKLVWIAETFIIIPDGRRLHEIGFYFLINIDSQHEILKKENEFIGEEDGFLNRWVNIEKLDEYNIVPEFVVDELMHIDIGNGIKHIVHTSIR